jgi:hypothetical protein
LNDKSPLVSNATLMCTDVETRKSTLDKFRKNYCVTIATATTKPTTGIYLDFDTYLQEIKKLSRLADRQKALKAQVDVSGLTSQAKDLANLVALSSNTAVQTALSPNFKETKQLLNAFTIEFGPVPSIGDINNVKLDPGGSKYVDFSGGVKPNGMLEKINAAIGAAGTKPDAKSLSILKTNLAYIALNFSSIDASVSQLSDAQQAVSDLNTYLASPSSTSCSSPPKNIIEFQAILNKMALDVIDAADSANCAAQSIPLPEPISRPLVDQWYGNKQVTVTLTKNTRVPLFDVNSYGPPALIGSTSVTSTPSGSASSDQAAPKKTTDSSQQKGAQNPGSNPSSPPGADASKGTSTPAPATSSSGTVVRQTAFRVHDVYRYELGFGFMRSNVKDVKYQLVQQTSTTNGTSTTSQLFVQTRKRSYHFLPTVDLLVYPIKRDYFPWKPRFYKEKPPAWWTRFAGLLGFSLSSPTSDFFLGSAYMPNAGIGLKAGLHLSYVDSLPAGVKLGVPITATSTHVEQKFDHGYFIGVEFNAQLFKDTLGVILKK